jgi:hypothetical protein
MTWCLINHRIRLKGVVLSYGKRQLYIYLLYGCETLSVILRYEESCRLVVLRTRCGEKYLELRDRRREEDGENYIMRTVHNFYYSPNFVRVIKTRKMRRDI